MDGYVVPLDEETLKDAPRYDADERPSYDETYGRGIYDYYGVGAYWA